MAQEVTNTKILNDILKELRKQSKLRQRDDATEPKGGPRGGGTTLEQQLKQYDEIIKKINSINNVQINQITPQLQLELELLGQQKEAIEEQLSSWNKFGSTKDRVLKGIKQMHSGITSMGRGINSLSKDFANLDMGALTYDEVKKAANTFDELQVKVAKATGQGKIFTKRILEAQKSLIKLGVTNEQTAESFLELYGGMADFSLHAPRIQKNLMAHAVMMEKLGISYKDTGSFMNMATKSMRLTWYEAVQLQRKLGKYSMALRVPFKQLVSDWALASPRLSLYGNKINDVFARLEAQSKATGVGMSDLLAVTQGFDEFESAAKKTAMLNAVLGVNLNIMDVMYADEPQRISMIRNAIKMSGINLDTANKFQLLAIMSPLAMKDAEKFKKLYGGHAKTMQEIQKLIKPEVVGRQKIGKSVTDSVTALEKVKSLQESIVNIASYEMLFALSEQAKAYTTNRDLQKSLAQSAQALGRHYNHIVQKTTEWTIGLGERGVLGAFMKLYGFLNLWANKIGAPLGEIGTGAAALVTGVGGTIGIQSYLKKKATQKAAEKLLLAGGATMATQVTRAALSPAMIARGASPLVAGATLGASAAKDISDIYGSFSRGENIKKEDTYALAGLSAGALGLGIVSAVVAGLFTGGTVSIPAFWIGAGIGGGLGDVYGTAKGLEADRREAEAARTKAALTAILPPGQNLANFQAQYLGRRGPTTVTLDEPSIRAISNILGETVGNIEIQTNVNLDGEQITSTMISKLEERNPMRGPFTNVGGEHLG